MGVTVRPFMAVRPQPKLASAVAALPYDVMNTEEAREMAAGNEYSFLRVDKAEIDLPPETDQYSPQVYAKAKENLQWLIKNAMQQDEQPNFYVYRLTGYGQTQTGLAACVSAAEYERGLIKRHEFTRPDKERDRVNHVEATEAHTGPIFLAYRSGDSKKPAEIMADVVKSAPEYDFTAEDSVRHELWVISNAETQNALVAAFAQIPALYIADGHHRNATAAIVAKKREEVAPNPNAEHNFYLAVIFPHDELAILDYNRVVTDLNGKDNAAFISALEADWQVEKSAAPVKPSRKYEVGMYLANSWYRLTLKNPPNSADAIANLDCSVLQNTLLAPVLGITDPRADKRIDFVGGIRGLEGLEIRVNSGEMAVAFALFPTSMDELMAVADANQIMPPKSTWFEPKLRSGLLVHLF
ncbi:MAG: DUF1015 family protein [Defluviitaleaceae bacterium]|nr:DUF1015 family protein [Defluviitaleaceae bacterium]MCL2263282.1 DUF1015 family protein [Defluviitaleaceae bacterium]